MTFEDYRISPTISNHTDLVFYSSFRCWYFRQCLLMFLASQMTQQVNFWHNLRNVLTRLSIHKGTKWNCLKLYAALLLCKGNAFSTLRPGIEKLFIYSYATHLNVTQRAHLFLVVWRDSRDLILGGMAWHTSSLLEQVEATRWNMDFINSRNILTLQYDFGIQFSKVNISFTFSFTCSNTCSCRLVVSACWKL